MRWKCNENANQKSSKIQHNRKMKISKVWYHIESKKATNNNSSKSFDSILHRYSSLELAQRTQ